MIYTSEEYCNKFLIGGKKVSPRTIKRCCEKDLLPSTHHATKLPGEQGQWVIEIDEIEEKKVEPVKTIGRSLNVKHYSW